MGRLGEFELSRNTHPLSLLSSVQHVGDPFLVGRGRLFPPPASMGTAILAPNYRLWFPILERLLRSS